MANNFREFLPVKCAAYFNGLIDNLDWKKKRWIQEFNLFYFPTTWTVKLEIQQLTCRVFGNFSSDVDPPSNIFSA